MKTLHDLYFDGRKKTLVYLADMVEEPAEKLDLMFCGGMDFSEIKLKTILELSIEWEISVEEVLQALAASCEEAEENSRDVRQKMMQMRKQKGLDYKEAAVAAGVEVSTYILLEKGHASLYGFHLEGLAKAMGVDPMEFY